MSKLRDALRKKFKTPREAILALGLDETLLTERAYDSVNPLIKEKTMKKVKLSALGTVAYGALTTFLRPQLAEDAKIDLAKGLRNITAKNFKAKRPVFAAWITESVKDKLDPQFAQDGALNSDGLDAVLDMIELACDEFPDDMKKDDKKDDKKKAEDEDMSDEDADMADDEDETDEEKAARMAKRAKDKKAKDAKAKDAKKAKDKDVNEADEEHDPDTAEKMGDDEDMDDDEKDKAMDAAIASGIEAGIKKERLRLEAVQTAKEHVRNTKDMNSTKVGLSCVLGSVIGSSPLILGGLGGATSKKDGYVGLGIAVLCAFAGAWIGTNHIELPLARW